MTVSKAFDHQMWKVNELGVGTVKCIPYESATKDNLLICLSDIKTDENVSPLKYASHD